ncbi:MAG TPA: CYCXC family (seleno)protein [Pyrinomonadaceae bacterium]
MKQLLVALVLLVVAIVVVASWSKGDQKRAPVNTPTVADRASAPSQAQMPMHEYAAKGRVPAYYETPPDISTLPPTLSPEIFTGNKRLAYQAAKEIPQTLAQLPCYCHCDRGHGHKSLHSCFESEHGENCGICIGEALMARNLEKRGVRVSEIRKQIIAAYGRP